MIREGGKTTTVTLSSSSDHQSSHDTAASSPDDEATLWDPDVAARARWKVDASVLPLLFLGFLVLQIDRMNLASALTDGFAEDMGISQNTVNLGNQLMFLGMVVIEIPCNMALQKVGPRKWMSTQVLLFGTVATMQVFLKNRTGFLVSRMALGLAEAGYTPGAIFTLSTWYAKKELARRVALLFFGMFGGNAISPLLASGILRLGGSRGLKGWQWLFLIEGVFSIAVAFLLFFFLPGFPDAPKPLVGPGLVRFTAQEQEALQGRLEKDDMGKRPGAHGVSINLRLVWRTVCHYQRWGHYVATFTVFSTWSPLTTYTPSIIMSLGFDRTTANALAAVGGALALVVIFLVATLSDKTNQRGGAVLLSHATYLIALIVLRQVQGHVGKWSRWGLWTAVNALAVGYHPAHNTWLQLNCREAGERSIAIAMWVMSALSGLMVGTQYFRAGDGPFYDNGLLIMIVMVTVGMAAAALQRTFYVVHNKRVREGQCDTKDGSEPMIYTP